MQYHESSIFQKILYYESGILGRKQTTDTKIHDVNFGVGCL